jgi:hypothetical protein
MAMTIPFLPQIARSALSVHEWFMKILIVPSVVVIQACVVVRNILVLARGGRILADMLFVEIDAAELHLRQPGTIGGRIQALGHGQ